MTDRHDRASSTDIDAEIAQRVRDLDFGAILAAEGQTTVELDDHGNLQRVAPDGTVTQPSATNHIPATPPTDTTEAPGHPEDR